MNYIIDFVDTLSRGEINAYCSGADITIIKQYTAFGNAFLCSAATMPDADVLIESIVLDDAGGITLLGVDITLVDSTSTQSIVTDSDQTWWKIASINNIDFDSPVQTHINRGDTSTVYVVDSGIKQDHPDFVDASVVLLHSFNGDFVDYNGHGTALSSLIVGKTCGLTNAQLKVVKIFQSGTPTLQSDMVAALNAILADYFANGNRASIVNMSWSIAKNEYINAKIQLLIDNGIYVVASAGNSGVPIADVTPACMPNVFTVGAYNKNFVPCSFTNYTGTSVISLTQNDVNYGVLDTWAPGEDIWVAKLDGTYGFAAGTSTSAAIVSGGLAYNFRQYTDPDGFIYGEYSTVLQEDRLKYFDRVDLLTLAAPYDLSVNRIATYKTNSVFKNTKFILEAQAGVTRVYSEIITPINTTRILSDETLPDFITISNRGEIFISHPAIMGDYVKYGPYELNLIQRDGSTGLVIFDLFVRNQNLTVQDMKVLAETDPVLSIFLADELCGWSLAEGCIWTGCGGGCNYIFKDCVCI